jgi:16S rRNA (cytosine967-C5)-methyltransferase
MEGALGRGEGGAIDGVEQFHAADLCAGEPVENRRTETGHALGNRAGEVHRRQLGLDGRRHNFSIGGAFVVGGVAKFGLFYVQDPSTLLAVRELAPQPNESVLDLCAAPGGKTAFIAELIENRGRITAQDREPDRLKLIQENCARLGVTCVEASVAPTGIIAKPSKRFDRVLVDAPCSNTGVMRRRVDLRWRIRPEEIERLSAAQLELLRQAAPRVKPGGVLIYSTCSLEPEENNGVVKQFLTEHPDFKLESERELTPLAEGVDGAYVAKLRAGST